MSNWTDGPEAILAPTALATFLATHWDGTPLVIQDRGNEIYEGLLSIEELDALIHQSGPTFPAFRLVKDGSQVPQQAYTVPNIPWGTGQVSGFIEREHVRRFMADGCTFVMESCQRLHPAIGHLSRTFEQVFHCPSPVNLYITPPAAQGFQPHFDVQNVFVMQLHGTKKWRIFEPHIHRPVPSQAIDGAVRPGELLQEITLHPGDLLYIPRGYVHVAQTTNELSAHLSVSLMPHTWVDVFKALLDGLPADDRFRTAIQLQPSGPAEASADMDSTFDRLMEAFISGSDLEDALDDMAKRFVTTRLPATAGQLQALQNQDPIGLQSVLQRHPGIIWRVDSDGEQAHLHFHGKTTSIPWTAIAALRFMASGVAFQVSDIPGELGDDTRCELAQHLVEEGFLIRN